jgi:cytochrome c oxidase assembly protein subunit 15
MDMQKKWLERLLLSLLAYSLLVFLWGAWVRISGSGDGCGEHWPFCHGELIPDSYAVKVWIENFHRISTKLYGLFVIGLCFLSFRWRPKGHPLRQWSMSILIFTLIEGLIGAVIVLKGFVADDQSVARAVLIALHLMNTFILVSTIIGAHLASQYGEKIKTPGPTLMRLLGPLSIGILAVGGTGALAALSTTLFPSQSLLQSFLDDFSVDSHFLLKIRISHPLLAIGLLLVGWRLTEKWVQSENNSLVRAWAWRFRASLVIAFSSGLLTLGLLSPTSMKLVHLLIAHFLWICFCYLFFQTRMQVNSTHPVAQ